MGDTDPVRCEQLVSEFIFFYGTLLPQYVPPTMRHVLEGFRPYGEGSVNGVLYDFGEHPGAMLKEGTSGKVYGAVYQLPKDGDVLAQLDRYEGFDAASPGNSLFVRKQCPVTLADGSVLQCWIYEYNGNPAGLPIIASGRFAKKGTGR
jgi:gamma-glutamylcyclotransferase (GGCT)/AIG2-like uncharacterized protein YtfP